MKITATVITLNEQHNIADALSSLSWADEIIVVDSESRDRTVEIAQGFTDPVTKLTYTYQDPYPGVAISDFKSCAGVPQPSDKTIPGWDE